VVSKGGFKVAIDDPGTGYGCRRAETKEQWRWLIVHSVYFA
jgi:hypothetical protein